MAEMYSVPQAQEPDDRLELFCYRCDLTFVASVPYTARWVYCPRCDSKDVHVFPKGHIPVDLGVAAHYKQGER